MCEFLPSPLLGRISFHWSVIDIDSTLNYLSQSLSKTKFGSFDLFVENPSQQKEQDPDNIVSCWGIFFGGERIKSVLITLQFKILH